LNRLNSWCLSGDFFLHSFFTQEEKSIQSPVLVKQTGVLRCFLFVQTVMHTWTFSSHVLGFFVLQMNF
jgi:hypothetical protein